MQASAVDPLAQQAYDLDQRYGLYQWEGSFWTNLRGQNEKYIASTVNGVQHPLFILPNGDLYLWDTSIADSTRIATLSAAYYADPFLLCSAQSPGYAPLAGGEVQLSVSGGALTITRAANFTEDFFVQVSVSDGAAADSESFKVSVTNSAAQSSSLASLQSVALAIQTPTLAPAAMKAADEAPSTVPDLHSAWLSNLHEDRFGGGDLIQSADLLASRANALTASLHDDYFAGLSPRADLSVGSDRETRFVYVDHLLADHEEHGRLFSAGIASDSGALFEEHAGDSESEQWSLLEQTALEVLHDSLSARLTLPAVAVW